MRFPDKATVPSDMSLDLHFGCRFSPGCGGLVHLHLAGQASATLRKIRLTCKKTVKLHQWLTRFQIATERCKKSCKSAIHCRFLPPLSGQPEGYRSCSLRTATCPRNNQQPVNLLETHLDPQTTVCSLSFPAYYDIFLVIRHIWKNSSFK